MEPTNNEIYDFFTNRGVDSLYISLFMRFLIEYNAYEEFVNDLSSLIVGNADTTYYSIERWQDWSSKNLEHSEHEIIYRFLIWNMTLHEDLWCKLSDIWSRTVTEYKRKIFKNKFRQKCRNEFH